MARSGNTYALAVGSSVDLLSQKGVGSPAGVDGSQIRGVDIINYSQYELTVQGIGADGGQPPFSRKFWACPDGLTLARVTPITVLDNVTAAPSSKMSATFYVAGDDMPDDIAPYGLGYLSYGGGGKALTNIATQLQNQTSVPTQNDGTINIQTNFPVAGLTQQVIAADSEGNLALSAETGDGAALQFIQYLVNLATNSASVGGKLQIGYNQSTPNLGTTEAVGPWTFDAGPTFQTAPTSENTIGASTFISVHKFTTKDAGPGKVWELRLYNDGSLRLADVTDSKILYAWFASGNSQAGGKQVFSDGSGGITGMSSVISGTGNTASVAHGLAAAPTLVWVQLYGTSAAPANVANVGATTFDVQGITGAIAWKALAIR